MKPAVRMAAAASLLAGAAVAGIVALPHWLATPDLQFQGRSLDGWVADLESANQNTSHAAALVAKDVIVPKLVEIIQRDTADHPAKIALIEALDRLPGLHVDFVPAEGRRALALEDLARLGPAGVPAMPELMRLLGEQDERLIGHAATALVAVRCDPSKAVPALLRALLRPDGHGRPEVVEALAAYGPRASLAVPQLERLQSDYSSKEIRLAVPRALKAIDPDRFAKLPVR